MSLTVSSAGAAPTPLCATFNQIPTQDSACAIHPLSNATDILEKCCKDAPIEKYPEDCGFYCLSVGQSNGDLIKCFQENGVSPADIVCRGNMSATATESIKPKASETGKDKASKTKDNDSPSKTDSAASESSTNAAPAMVMAPLKVSKAGVGILAMLFVSAAAGALL